MRLDYRKKFFFILLLFMNFGLFSKITVDVPDVFVTKKLLSDVSTYKVNEEDVAECCQELDSKIDEVIVPELTSIESKLDEWIGPLTETVNSKVDEIVIPELETIESKIDALVIPECPSLVKGNIITNGTNSITTEGLYTLTVNTQACITIDVDRVTIDLAGFTLSCDSPNAVIEILPGHENIKIKDGKIEGASGLTNDGILTGSGCQLVQLYDLIIRSCDNGIHFSGTETDFVKACKIDHCFLQACNKGVALEYAKKCRFKSCGALQSIEAGFEQSYCDYNVYEKCKALDTSNDATDERAIGFSSFAGTGNLFIECVAEGTAKTVDSDFCQGAIGFLLTGTENDMEDGTKIVNCIANSTSVLSTGDADALGIKLESVLISGTSLQDLLTSGTDYTGGDVHYFDWSSDSRYLAVAGDQLDVSVYKIDDDSSIDFIISYTIAGGVGGGFSRSSVDWSPDGNFLAVGTNNGDTVVLSFDGSNLTHVLTQAYGTRVFMVRWSPDGNYLAIGGDGPTTPNGDELHIYSFDGTSVTFVDSYNAFNDRSIYTADWSQNGEYLAIGITFDGFFVYSFDGSSLTLVDSKDPARTVYDVNWSSDGRYLAVSIYGNGGSEIRVYEFDGLSVTQVASFNNPSDDINAYSSRWSPDGKYLLATNQTSAESYEIFVLRFTGSSLVEEKSYEWGTSVFAAWSPNGKYIAAVGDSPATGTNIKLFTVMDGPSGCLVDGNRVCNAVGGDGLHGVGILGSGESFYIKNVLYKNEVPFNQCVLPKFGNFLGTSLDGSPKVFDNVFV